MAKARKRVVSLPHVRSKLLKITNINEFRKLFGWKQRFKLIEELVTPFEYVEDLNDRRRRDAEVIAMVASNVPPGHFVEIGTGRGYSTALIAINSPISQVTTVNLPFEDAISNRGGVNITEALRDDEVGSYYKKLNLQNIHQVFSDSANWRPPPSLSLGLIDGCHDESYVISDSLKLLNSLIPGGILMWHDFNPSLRWVFPWIDEVCRGVDRLIQRGFITDHIYLLEDSWTAVYRIPI